VLFSGWLLAHLCSPGQGWQLRFAHTGTESSELLQEAAAEGKAARPPAPSQLPAQHKVAGETAASQALTA